MLGADGKPRVCERVWISSIGCADSEQTGKLTAGFGASPDKIGPEFTFGLSMQKFTNAPILIIKTSWGGKSLHTDFRPPSAGPYVFNETLLSNLQKQGKDLFAIRALFRNTTRRKATKSLVSLGSKDGTIWSTLGRIRIATSPAATMPTAWP
jgi:hypothetical protein